MTMEPSQAKTGDWTQVHAYFAELCRHLSYATESAPTLAREAREQAPAALFWLLTQREFTYLTRKRCEPFRDSVEGYLGRAIEDARPIRLYYDIGGGYRASLQPGHLAPTFTPGLGELLALAQIHRFVRKAQRHCPVPIRFTLVVDNLCARYVNGIPLAATQRYVAGLRAILRHFDLAETDLLVESDHVSPAEYERAFEATLAETEHPVPTPAAHANVERFLGRRVDEETAQRQLARYTAGGATTEAGLARIIDGVRLTQRATPHTLAFRAFPGGDVRIQCGEVGLGFGTSGRIRPLLLSSANYTHYRKEPIDVADWRIPHVQKIDLLYA